MMAYTTALRAFSRAPSIGMSTWYKGILISNLATEQDTGGAFEFVETKMKRGTEPPPHVHDREHEFFYILAGELNAYVGDECLQAGAGECIFLPRREPHAFRIQSAEIHMLVMMTPGGFMGASAAMSLPAQSLDIPPDGITYATADLAETIRIFADYGIRFLTPEEIVRDLPAFPLTQ